MNKQAKKDVKIQETVRKAMVAAQDGDLEGLMVYADAIGSVDAAISDSETLLMRACSSKKTDCAIWLLAAGANVGLVDREGRTALSRAAMEGALDIVEALMEAGSPDMKDFQGFTALMFAAQQASGQVCQALAKAHGVSAVNDFGWSALQCAARFGNVGAAKAIACFAGCDPASPNGDRAMEVAAYMFDLPMLGFLAGAGLADRPSRMDGPNPLLRAMRIELQKPHIEACAASVADFLSSLYGVEGKWDGKTAYEYAMKRERADAAKLLLAKQMALAQKDEIEKSLGEKPALRGNAKAKGSL